MFVKNAWHAIGYSQEFETGTPAARQIIGKPIVVYRTDAGDLVALDDRCSHRFAPLSRGRCEGDMLRCMYHGALFERTGQCIQIPGQDKVPAQARIQSYAVAERSGWVFVWGGDPAGADPGRLPNFLPLEGGEFTFAKGAMDYRAAASQINANLLDFTHLPFVHTASFGAREDSWKEARSKITPVENGISVTWWVPGAIIPAHETRLEVRVVDQLLMYEYTVPGHLSMMMEFYPENTARSCDFGTPSIEPVVRDYNAQSVCATGEGTARYYYAWGVPRAIPGAEEVASMRLEIAGRAFEEDRLMIEAQQRIIDSTPDDIVMVPNAADKAITLFERLMAKAAREDSESAGPLS
ncbi:Rieske 2Fe-2S domain-containing protein [Sphingobium sp. DC-2]|uniref:Rieske 2Fe-2S domain-containing protein n=1 Tax=Sphingobium sp. DC-2 TaxID=1303256 RepID=UPI0004C2CDF6|nr:Rieske 2Fe-2S domain-containing protein [Sphingobium sp. DC-2]